MTKFSGSYKTNLGSQTLVAIPDRPEHLIGVSVVSATQNSSDALWNGAVLTVWGTADTVGGNGDQRGYFRNVHANGDVDHGTFEARVTTSGTSTTLAGKWRFSGGTGRFAKLTGDGVFEGRQVSPTDSEASWSGSYNLH